MSNKIELQVSPYFIAFLEVNYHYFLLAYQRENRNSSQHKMIFRDFHIILRSWNDKRYWLDIRFYTNYYMPKLNNHHVILEPDMSIPITNESYKILVDAFTQLPFKKYKIENKNTNLENFYYNKNPFIKYK